MVSLNRAKELLETSVKNCEIPGASFAYVTKDGFITDFVGYKQVEPEKIKLEQGTMYDMASCTKVVCTTTLVLRLIEEGYFSLKTKVKDILPDFAFDEITILHLLTHTSGMIPDDKNYRKCTNKDEMYEFINSIPLAYKTGSDLQYSDFGFIVLGKIIEHYKGNLEEYANEVIFKPLEMTHTMFNPKEKGYADLCVTEEIQADRGGAIIGEAHDGKAFRMGGVSGNAGLFSTVEDISRFVQMLLRNGENVLSPASINLLKTYRTENKPSIRTLGWIANDNDASDGDYYSSKCLYHTGFTGTSIYVDFERGCGIVLLINAVHPHRGNPYTMSIRNRVHNVILSEYR